MLRDVSVRFTPAYHNLARKIIVFIIIYPAHSCLVAIFNTRYNEIWIVSQLSEFTIKIDWPISTYLRSNLIVLYFLQPLLSQWSNKIGFDHVALEIKLCDLAGPIITKAKVEDSISKFKTLNINIYLYLI